MLKKEIDEKELVDTLLLVNKVKKINQDQISDILSVRPNYLPPVIERVNSFLEKLSHVLTMLELQTKCDNETYANNNPEDMNILEEYFLRDSYNLNKHIEDMVDISCMFNAIGKFCMSTEKFFKEINGNPGDTQEEILANVLMTLDADMDEYIVDEPTINRYGHLFFKSLLAKNKQILPKGISAEDVFLYIKDNIYNEDGWK